MLNILINENNDTNLLFLTKTKISIKTKVSINTSTQFDTPEYVILFREFIITTLISN